MRQRAAEAGVESRALVESARAQAEAIRAQAAAEGREEGLASATEVVARAALERQDLLASAEPQLVELAFAVAQRVLARVVERDREAVVDIASRALEAVRQRIDVRLRVHPDDLASLRDAEPRLIERLARARCIALLSDPSVGRGGVVVETEAGSVDARLATQLAGLRRALTP
jgi:flagellar biosynthesis/type III secretory pathway protein FliH